MQASSRKLWISSLVKLLLWGLMVYFLLILSRNPLLG